MAHADLSQSAGFAGAGVVCVVAEFGEFVADLEEKQKRRCKQNN